MRDTYDLGLNEVTFTLKIWIKPSPKPFYVLDPTNTGPVFSTDLPTNPVSFNVTKSWEYLLPKIYDFDKDAVVVKATGSDVDYITAESTPARLLIKEGSTTEAEIGIRTVQIDLTDLPVDLADPKTSSYKL